MLRVSQRALIELIYDLVNDTSKSWQKKRSELIDLMSYDEVGAVEEFSSWFERGD